MTATRTRLRQVVVSTTVQVLDEHGAVVLSAEGMSAAGVPHTDGTAWADLRVSYLIAEAGSRAHRSIDPAALTAALTPKDPT